MTSSVKKSLIGITIVICAIFVWNYVTLQYQVSKVSSSDSRNQEVVVFAHYGWFINPNVVVFDLRKVSGEDSPMDVTRTLLQFAEKQKNRRFDKIILSHKGNPKFYLKRIDCSLYYSEILLT